MKLLPKEPTPEMIEAVPFYHQHECYAIYKAMYKAAPEVAQEPVRYEFRVRMLPNGDFNNWMYCKKEFYEVFKEQPIEDIWEYEVRALYTHPKPNQSEQHLNMVESEPLSVEAMNQIIDNHDFRDGFYSIIRSVEKAHEIGVK